jgi:hypothetical protein
MSRKSSGLATNLCSQCAGGTTGVKRFNPQCAGCQAKKARWEAYSACPCEKYEPCEKCVERKILGMRTGTEPCGNVGNRGARRTSKETFDRFIARQERGRKKRAML